MNIDRGARSGNFMARARFLSNMRRNVYDFCVPRHFLEAAKRDLAEEMPAQRWSDCGRGLAPGEGPDVAPLSGTNETAVPRPKITRFVSTREPLVFSLF